MNKKYENFLCLSLAFFFSASTGYAKIRSADEFQAKMEQLVQKLSPKTKASVHVELLGTDRILYTHDASDLMIPASSMKLLTTQAALDIMGPAYAFETKIYVDGTIHGDTIQGNLILQGNGDPFLVSERIWLLAKEVARHGIRKITGGIKVNNTAFSADYRDLLDFNNAGEPFASIVSATSVNFNSLELHVTPTINGARARLEVGPVTNNYVQSLQGSVTTVPGARANVELHPLSTSGNQENFQVSGSIGHDSDPRVQYASIALPSSYIANIFSALLRSLNISVVGDFAGMSTVSPESLGDPLASLSSLPLQDLVRSYNTYSNNFMAEQVFQGMGAFVTNSPASVEKSRKALVDYLKKYKNCGSAVIDNGSGLSWNTRVNSRCFVEVFQNSYRDFRVYADLISSLPIGGQTGTLKNRFKKVGPDFDPMKVRAKTGTLWSQKAVSSLVGITQTHSGETIVFSLLLNDSRNDSSLLQGMRDWEDSCVELMQQIKL